MVYDVNGNPISVNGTGGGGKHPWETNGVLNAMKIAKQLAKTSWTTKNSGMPNASDSSTIANDVTTTGMPYSSASVEDGYIGIGLSLYSFMSAVSNPNSVLYTEKSKGYTGYAYYGTICTSLVCAAWGLPCLITTAAFPKCDFIEEVGFSEIELGDMMLGNGHARLVTGITRDSNGVITNVQLTESVRPRIIINNHTYDSFVSYCTGYTAYRYKNINSVDSYSAVPFLQLMDEQEEEIVYPDIMTKFGDKVTRKKGTNIDINVLDSTGYNSIKVYKDGVLIDTKTTIADFTISAPDVGAYEVRMTGTGKSSSTFFDIVDCTINVTENTLAFTTTYSATAVGGYPVYTTDENGKATTWNNPKRVHLVTEEENVAREINIAKMKRDADCNGGIRIYVQGIYGGVSFEHSYA